MYKNIEEILSLAPTYEAKIRELRDIILSDLVMVGEVPAPTFKEEEKMRIVVDRFAESNLEDYSTDDVGNAFGLIKGTQQEKTILLVAHMDTVFSEKHDHTVSVEQDVVTGMGLADNSLGVAVLTTLPFILERLDIQFKSNVLLMTSSRSLGKGNLEGLQFFLRHKSVPIDYGICVEGHRLGRLSYSSIGMLRGEIHYRVPEKYDWTRFGAEGAIVSLNDVINEILEIPRPQRPRTTIVLNSIESGAAFNTVPTHAVLQLEIRSESADMVDELEKKIRDICAEVAFSSGAEVHFYEIARRKPGGIPFSHPLVYVAQSVMKKLDIPSRVSPSTSELSACIAHRIPAITVGMTRAQGYNEEDERVTIEPISQGIAQLITLLVAIDEGYCDVS